MLEIKNNRQGRSNLDLFCFYKGKGYSVINDYNKVGYNENPKASP